MFSDPAGNRTGPLTEKVANPQSGPRTSRYSVRDNMGNTWGCGNLSLKNEFHIVGKLIPNPLIRFSAVDETLFVLFESADFVKAYLGQKSFRFQVFPHFEF